MLFRVCLLTLCRQSFVFPQPIQKAVDNALQICKLICLRSCLYLVPQTYGFEQDGAEEEICYLKARKKQEKEKKLHILRDFIVFCHLQNFSL